MGSILLLLSLGIALFVAVPVLASLVRDRQRLREHLPESLLPVNLTDNNNGVIVAEGRGHLVFINDKARDWFGMNGDAPNLETLAELVQPSESFIELFGKEGQASFRLGKRRVEATSHYIPREDVQQLIIVLRELSGGGTTIRGERDPSQIMNVISEITQAVSGSMPLADTLNAILNSISEVIPYDTGEVTLWEDDLQILRPLGRGGVRAHDYYQRFEQTDGVYHLDDSFSGWLARYRQSLLVADVSARPDVRSKLNDYPFLSFVGIPLSIGDRFIGTLEMASLKRGAFDHEDLALLQAVAGQAAIAIENARLYQTQVERVAELSGLQQIAQAMSNFADPRQMYNQIVGRIGGLMNSDMVGILLYDEVIQVLAGQTPFQGIPDSVGVLFRIPVNEASAIWPIWTKRDWWYTNDVPHDETLAALGIKKLLEPLGVTRLLLMPMNVADRRIGLILVANKRDGSGYTEDDMRLMSVFASQTGIVVENARLYNTQQQRGDGPDLGGLERLETAMDVLSDAGAMTGQISQLIARIMNVEMAGVLLFNTDQSKLLPQEPFIGLDNTILPYYEIDVPPNGRARQLYTSNQPWYVNDVENDRTAKETGIDSLARMTDIRYTLIAPLRTPETQFGVIQVANKLNGQRFNEDDVKIAAKLADQAAKLITSAGDYRTIRDRAVESDGLRQIAEWAGSTLPLDEAIQKITAFTAQMLSSSVASIALLEKGTGKLVMLPQYVYGLPALTEPFIIDVYAPEMQSSITIARRSFYSNDVSNDSRVLPIYRAFAERFRIDNVVQVPLIVRDQSIGELSIGNKRAGDYSKADVKLLKAIGVQIADAFERSRLYEATDANLRSRVEELDSLARVSTELNQTIDLERILEVIRVEAQRTTGAKVATVVLLKPQADWSAPDRPVIAQRLGEGKLKEAFYGVELKAIQQAEVVQVADYARDPMETNPGSRRSSLVVPIQYGGVVRGVIHLYSEIPNYFTQRGIDFVQSLAAQASLAVGNSSRYTEQVDRNDLLSQRADQLSQIFELGRMVRTETNLDTILDAVANAVADAVGFNVVLISVVDREKKVTRRMAQAGVPLATFEEVKKVTPPLSVLESLMLSRYQISGSYLLLGDQEADWKKGYVPLVTSPVTEIVNNKAAWHPKDLMIVPFRDSNGQINGIMSVDEPRNGRRPTQQTVEALEIFGNQAAFAIENFELLQTIRREADATRRERDRLAQLHTVAGQIQRVQDVPGRLKVIAEGIREQGWGRVAITLRDANLEPRETITSGYSADEVEKLKTVLLPGIVWRQRLSDADFRKHRLGGAYYLRYSDPWVTENKLLAGTAGGGTPAAEATIDLTSWNPLDVVYLPIYGLDQSRVIGIIAMDQPVDNKPPNEAALRPIELFATQAASTIENTRLIEERTRSADQEARLNAIMEAVSSTLDTREILLSMAKGLSQLMPFETMSVALPDWTEQRFETQRYVASGNDFSDEPGEALDLESTALGRAYREQIARVYRPADLSRDEELADLKGWIESGEQVSMAVPLVAGGRSVGVLHIGSTTSDGSTFDAQLPLVQRMANLTAVSVENARLFQQAIDRERFSASLGRVGQTINEALDLTVALDGICGELQNLLDVSGVLIWQVQEGYLVNAAGRGAGASDFGKARVPVNDLSYLASQVLAEKGATYVNEFTTQTQYKPVLPELNVQAVLIVPLLREDRAVGVLALIELSPERKFNPEDVERASAFAVQAAIAIERATLETNLQDRANELTALTQITGELTSTLEPEALANLIVEQSARLVPFDTATLWLREGDTLIIRAAKGYVNVEDLIGVRVDISDSVLFREISSRTQPVLNIPDITQDARFVFNPDRITRSWMGIALNSKGALTGLLIVEKAEPAFYTVTQESLALAYANQAAVAIENAQLFQERDKSAQANTVLYQESSRRATELNQQAQRLTLLNRVASSLAQTLDIENALEVTLRELISALGMDRGSAILIEPINRVSRLIIEYPRADQAPAGVYLPMIGTPVFDEAKKGLQPVGVFDVMNDPRLGLLREFFQTRGILSTLFVPLLVGGQVIGAITIDATNEYHLFSADEIELAQTITSQAAVAVQNANLFEQSSIRTRELETLFEATQTTGATLDLAEVITNATNQMIPSLMVDSCSIFLFDPAEDRLEVRSDLQAIPDPVGVQAPGTLYPLIDFPTRQEALTTRQVITLHITDDTLDPAEKHLFEERAMSGRMILPMIVREQPIGLIAIEFKDKERHFDAASIRLARALATQTAIAVDNARLQTDTTGKLNELVAINELSTALAATIDSAELYKTMRQQFPLLVDAPVTLLAVYNTETNQVTYPVAIRDGQDTVIAPHPLSTDEISYVIAHRLPLLLAGDDMDQVMKIFGVEKLITNARSFIGVPLLTGDAIVGALALADERSTRAFGTDEQRVLTTVAAQLAVSIQNSRLFERNRLFTAELESAVQQRTDELRRERDRINFLYRITTGLTASLDMEQVLYRALEMMANATGAEMGAILGIDSLSDSLVYKATYDLKNRPFDKEMNYAQDEGLIGWVIQAQQAIVVGNVQADPRWLQRGEYDNEVQSAIVALLEANEDILGVVLLYSPLPNAFNDDHLRLATSAAGQIATAMNNAELYGLIREQAERLGAMVRREQVDSTKNAAIVESIADGIMVADNNGEIIQFNGAAERILGLPKKSIMGRTISDMSGLYTASGGQRWIEALETWMLDPTLYKFDDVIQERLELPDGKIVAVVLSPVTMADQFLGTVSVFRDITRETEVDRMKSEFVATVSHELRTPMTSIKGYADLLLIGAAGQVTEQQTRFLGTIKTNADRLSVLVNELLDISRIDRGVIKLNLIPTNMLEVTDSSVSHLRARIANEKKPLNIREELPETLPLVNADFDKLVQILNNVLDNAFNYTPAGGTVTVMAEHEVARESVLITVKDTGVGIPKESQARVFERFFRGDDNPLVMETSGTGLGLAIVKEYVQMHNGTIWLQSEIGRGTTFYIRLPILK